MVGRDAEVHGSRDPLFDLGVPAEESGVGQHHELIIHGRDPATTRESPTSEDRAERRPERMPGLCTTVLVVLDVTRDIELPRVRSTSIGTGIQTGRERQANRLPCQVAHHLANASALLRRRILMHVVTDRPMIYVVTMLRVLS